MIFDVDGTLVDISQSYAQTVILTSYIYSENILGIRNLPDLSNWFTNEFYNDLKQLIGFNSDYFCTVVFIDFLLTQLKPAIFTATKIPFLQCSFTDLKVNSFLELKESWNNYLVGNFKNNQTKPDVIIERSKYKELIKNNGSIVELNYIERIFQEVYYGADKFTQYYNLPSKYYQESAGYYTKETLLIPYKVLDWLYEQKIPLGIFTGRPKPDLDLLFEYFSLEKYFNSKYIVTLTDMLEEEKKLQNNSKLSKPNPWGLLELKSRMLDTEIFLMIGDSPDDLIAGFKAQIIPIHFSNRSDSIPKLNFEFKSLSDWNKLTEILEEL